MPQNIFLIDKEKDKEMILYFSENPIAPDGFNRLHYAIKRYPELGSIQILRPQEKKIAVDREVDKYYRAKGKNMKEALPTIERKFAAIEQEFFSASSRLFDNHKWPDGDYKGYLTSMEVFPRGIERREFWLPYRNDDVAMQTIMHENLHFLFYDYFEKNFGNALGERHTWELSEIVNDIILARTPLNGLFTSPLYTKKLLADKTAELSKAYDSSRSMGEFTQKAISFLKSRNV